jgi:hypothetical protein
MAKAMTKPISGPGKLTAKLFAGQPAAVMRPGFCMNGAKVSDWNQPEPR